MKNVSENVLEWKPQRNDDGETLTCLSKNNLLPTSISIHDSRKIMIHGKKNTNNKKAWAVKRP